MSFQSVAANPPAATRRSPTRLRPPGAADGSSTAPGYSSAGRFTAILLPPADTPGVSAGGRGW